MNSSLFEAMSINDCQLSPNRIDIWQFPLTHAPCAMEAILNEEELTRAKRFYFPKHQRRFAVARMMLRFILSRYLPIAPEAINFSYNHYGKPSVANDQQLEFNISHSDELAILAIGQNSPLGIDVEFFSARPYQGIAKHLFSNQEQEQLAQLPNYFKPLAFFTIWSQKEAFIKTCGLGLSYPTEQFSVKALTSGQENVFDPLHHHYLQLVSFMPTIGCCAALCCDLNITSIHKLTLTDNTLILA
ncbi:4'-phosphopantetheinyl transferase family protein [Legionella sp. D16C41]|uniref:4'-phosphopantetheinyl transferase family protein n=1 Tax=Legionella sp. D16C41 TaxID=3402688 RepID=UPI003AF63FAC